MSVAYLDGRTPNTRLNHPGLRSRAAIERIGGKFEGILRAHRVASDFAARTSWRYSILASEWPETKRRLTERLQRS